jgi:hypothetical protein
LMESSEQAQGRQSARTAQLARWFRHGRSPLGRCAGPPRFVAQLGLGPAIEREVCRRNWMQRQVQVARMRVARAVSVRMTLMPVARMRAARRVFARVTAVRLTSAPVMLSRAPAEAARLIPARLTARVLKVARAKLARAGAAPMLVPPRVLPSQVERPAQAKAPTLAGSSGP